MSYLVLLAEEAEEAGKGVQQFLQAGGAYKGRTQVPPTADWEPAQRTASPHRRHSGSKVFPDSGVSNFAENISSFCCF